MASETLGRSFASSSRPAVGVSCGGCFSPRQRNQRPPSPVAGYAIMRSFQPFHRAPCMFASFITQLVDDLRPCRDTLKAPGARLPRDDVRGDEGMALRLATGQAAIARDEAARFDAHRKRCFWSHEVASDVLWGADEPASKTRSVDRGDACARGARLGVLKKCGSIQRRLWENVARRATPSRRRPMRSLLEARHSLSAHRSSKRTERRPT